MERAKDQQDAQAATADAGRLLDYLIVIAKYKTIVLGFPLLVTAFTALAVLILPNQYVATARILPPQQAQSSALAMLAQLGSIVGMPSSAAGVTDPKDLYIGLLKSRVIADRMIERYKLKSLYESNSWNPFVDMPQVDVREELSNSVKFVAGDEGIISISVEDRDASRSASMANAFVEELDKLSQRLAIGEAGQRRAYFEKQLLDAKEMLASAEVGLKKVQERTGMLVLDEQGKAIIEAAAELRARISAKEVELTAMRLFATAQNPDYRKAQEVLAGLKDELSKLERSEVAGQGDVMIPTMQVPSVGIDYVRALRNVKYYEMLYDMLAKQYEVARVDEAKNTPVIQVIDSAVAPDEKTKPHRGWITLIVAILVSLLTVVGVCLFDSFRQDAENARKLAVLMEHLRQRWLKRT